MRYCCSRTALTLWVGGTCSSSQSATRKKIRQSSGGQPDYSQAAALPSLMGCTGSWLFSTKKGEERCWGQCINFLAMSAPVFMTLVLDARSSFVISGLFSASWIYFDFVHLVLLLGLNLCPVDLPWICRLVFCALP